MGGMIEKEREKVCLGLQKLLDVSGGPEAHSLLETAGEVQDKPSLPRFPPNFLT